MDYQAAYDYLTERIHDTPLGTPAHRDYLARRRRIKQLLDQQHQEPHPPAA